MNLLHSVKIRLTLWYAFVLTVLLFAFSYFTLTEFERALHRDADRSLVHEVRLAEDSFLNHLKQGNRMAALDSHLGYRREHPSYGPHEKDWLTHTLKIWEKENQRLSQSRRMIQFVGLDHTVFLTNFKDWQEDIILPDFERDAVFMENGQSFQTIHFQRRPIRLYYKMVMRRGEPLFLIQGGRPLEDVKTAYSRLRLIVIVTIPIFVGAACVAGLFLAKRSFAPVNSMISKAREISAAYIEDRLPRTHTGDELDQLADTLNQMMDRIETSTRTIQDFSSDISHELKTPLAIIRGEIDLALRRSRSTEDLLETLRSIGEEVNELIHLVDDLLLLVRSDAKELQFVKIKVSMKEVLSQVLDRFGQRAEEKKISLRSDLADDAEVLGDLIYLKRLFSNLLDNAIKFTPEGGLIQIMMKTEKPDVVVSVEDTGTGIDFKFQSKVFSRFYRTDQARSKEGAGLGLNIAKAIVDAHLGKIQIESQFGQGTRVRVSIPVTY